MGRTPENPIDKEINRRMFDQLFAIRENRRLTGDIFLLILEASGIACNALPGHFVMIRLPDRSHALLRRPMSILSAGSENGLLKILYRAVGRGTVLLSACRTGDSLMVLGPLGNSFPLDGTYRKAILVAGGIGIPPLVFAIPFLERLGKDIELFYGTRTGEEQDVLLTLNVNSVPVFQATDDGTTGFNGFVTELLRERLERGSLGDPADIRLFSCGPGQMMHHTAQLCMEHQIESYFSVETVMACGIGLCQGCVIPVLDETLKVKEYRLACKDGPVFPGHIIAQEGHGGSIM